MHGDSVAHVALLLAVLLVAAKLGGELATRVKLAPVLGELLAGVVLGSVPWDPAHELATNASIDILANLGVLLLLFQVGLASTTRDVLRVGRAGALVAVLGTAASFGLGWVAVTLSMPSSPPASRVFIAAAVTATSVGITARVFKDMKQTATVEARTVLAAAVLDDILALVGLALVTGWLARDGAAAGLSAVDVAWLLVKTLGFLGVAIALGTLVTPRLFAAGARLETSGALLALGLSFCFVLSWAAQQMGLAPLVGAFAAGLILEELHSERFVARGELPLDKLVEPISDFLVPLFFVVIGARTDLSALAQPGALVLAAALCAAALTGKLTCALGTGPGVNRLSVAIAMLPRGEVTLVFASLGLAAGILDRRGYAALIAVVLVTTVIAPPALQWSLRRATPPRP